MSRSAVSGRFHTISNIYLKSLNYYFRIAHFSFTAVVPLNSSDRIDYNERFKWDHPDDMVDAYSAALHKGLPYPILTVAEYLAWDEEGFGWGRAYRYAGYFSSIALWYVTNITIKKRPFLFSLLPLLRHSFHGLMSSIVT